MRGWGSPDPIRADPFCSHALAHPHARTHAHWRTHPHALARTHAVAHAPAPTRTRTHALTRATVGPPAGPSCGPVAGPPAGPSCGPIVRPVARQSASRRASPRAGLSSATWARHNNRRQRLGWRLCGSRACYPTVAPPAQGSMRPWRHNDHVQARCSILAPYGARMRFKRSLVVTVRQPASRTLTDRGHRRAISFPCRRTMMCSAARSAVVLCAIVRACRLPR